MPEYTPRNQISYPLPQDAVKHASSPSALADTLKQIAFTADQAVERAGARNTQQLWDEIQAVSGQAQGNTALAQGAHHRVDALDGRVQSLETIAGVTPGAPTDAALNLLLGDDSSQSRGTLDDLYLSRFASGVRPEDHGAVGDGTTDDTEALEAALNEATGTFQRPIVLTPGAVYLISRPLAVTGRGVMIVCEGVKPATIISPNDTFDPLTITSDAPYATTQLATSVTIGTTQWQVDNASSVTPGSLMQVVSSKSWYFDPRPGSTDARKAELHLVERIEGNTIWTRDIANDGYNLATETVDVKFIRPVRVHLSNLIVKGFLPSGSTNTRGRDGIVIDGTFEAYFDRVSVENMPAAGISFRNSYRPIAQGGHVFDANGDATGYGAQFNGCRNGIIRGVLYAGCRRGVDVSGGNIPSINTLVENCVNLGGGSQSDGQPYGWVYGGISGVINFGFGSHGAADHTTYRGCFTTNIHTPYSLRGGNEIIENATHIGKTRGGFIRLITGENVTVRGVKLYAYEEGGAKEMGIFDGGSNIYSRRPDYFMRVSEGYNSSTSRVFVDDVDADVQEAFVLFDEGKVFTGRANFTNIRVIHATPGSATRAVQFKHNGPLIATGNQWTLGLIHGRRQGGSGGIAFTENVNIEGSRLFDYTLAPPSS